MVTSTRGRTVESTRGKDNNVLLPYPRTGRSVWNEFLISPRWCENAKGMAITWTRAMLQVSAQKKHDRSKRVLSLRRGEVLGTCSSLEDTTSSRSPNGHPSRFLFRFLPSTSPSIRSPFLISFALLPQIIVTRNLSSDKTLHSSKIASASPSQNPTNHSAVRPPSWQKTRHLNGTAPNIYP